MPTTWVLIATISAGDGSGLSRNAIENKLLFMAYLPFASGLVQPTEACLRLLVRIGEKVILII